MENDRRLYPRVSCNGSAALDLGKSTPIAARMVDLSLEGCHLVFDAPQRIARDAEMVMTFEIDNIPFGVRAQAKSIRSSTSIGVHFPQMTEPGRTDLQGLIGLMAQLTPQPSANWAPESASR